MSVGAVSGLCAGELLADKDIQLQAVETVRTWASLIITISTGTIVFTATFVKDLVPQGETLVATDKLLVSWIALAISTVLGVFVFSTLVARLNEGEANQLDMYSSPLRWFAVGQFLAFIIGIGFFAYFAYQNLP